MYETAIFIFRRDLRLVDNTALNMAAKAAKTIIPIFIFDNSQVSNANKYRSMNAVKFMCESLRDLSVKIEAEGGKLYIFAPSSAITSHWPNILSAIMTTVGGITTVNAVYATRDYTPFADARDKMFAEQCKTASVEYILVDDICLNTPGTILTTTDTPMQKFTPYYTRALTIPVRKPQTVSRNWLVIQKDISKIATLVTDPINGVGSPLHGVAEKQFASAPAMKGGRDAALELLAFTGDRKTLNKSYNNTHDNLATETTQLSAALKFGCISVREAHEKFSNALRRQLHWRDFYIGIVAAFPDILRRGTSLKPQYDRIKWVRNAEHLAAWCEGRTGFPIVDAAMRQLNTTGYMHNRGRLITASFLIKTLMINWRAGEHYFATMLIDYDPAVNNGNWQWVAGCGADSQPYFRIFNPWTQSAKHDPNAVYIKTWVKELSKVSPNDIHNWATAYKKYPKCAYPAPIVSYEDRRASVLKMYTDALKTSKKE